MDNKTRSITALQKETLNRLPGYLKYFDQLLSTGKTEIDRCDIMIAFNLSADEVKKDFTSIGFRGSKESTYNVEKVLHCIKTMLGYGNAHDAVLVGAGQLGKTLLSYDGFAEYGLNIVAGFDIDAKVVGQTVHDKQILSIEKLADICSRLNINIGIISVPSKSAQRVCDLLVRCGIKGIWNFTAVSLNVPDDIIVQNENLAVSFALLSNQLACKFKKNI